MTKSLKFGYEGEGPMLGRKTVYGSFPDVSLEQMAAVARDKAIDSIYFVVDEKAADLATSLRCADIRHIEIVTVDCPVAFYPLFSELGIMLFLRCAPTTDPRALPRKVQPEVYIKMVCEQAAHFGGFVQKANEIATLGHTVLLMPDYWTDRPAYLGRDMMAVFDELHPRVRVMPPVHHVLGMP